MNSYLSSVIDKNEFDFVIIGLDDLRDLRRNPALFLVWEPDSCALAVNVVRHGSKGLKAGWRARN